MARAIAGSLMDMAADETFSGIYANANEMTAWLSVRAYADLVSGSAFRSTDLGGGNMTVFLQLPLESLITAPEVGRVLVGAMLNAIYRRDGDITGRVLFLLDEAAETRSHGDPRTGARCGSEVWDHAATVHAICRTVGGDLGTRGKARLER